MNVMTLEPDVEPAGMVDELRDMAERLVADRIDHRRTRALRRTLPGYDPALFDTFAELGWLGILVPEADGGFGLGLAEMAAVVRALEKGLLAEPLLATAVLGTRVVVHGDGPARGDLLAGIVDGSTRVALALDPDDTLPDVRAVPTSDGGIVLHGRCGSVAGAGGATHFLIYGKNDREAMLFAVPATSAGVVLETVWRADDGPLGVITLDGVKLPPQTIVATAACAGTAIRRALDETRIVAAAALVGLVEAMLDMTVEFLKVRKQFDQPIGAFQAIQHKAVDLYIQKEVAVATLAYALRLAAESPDHLALAALRAKGRASATAVRMAREAIHLHGAIGFTDEYDLGLYAKHALTLSGWLGNATAHRRTFVNMGLALA